MGLVKAEAALSVEVRKESMIVGNQGRVDDNDPGEPPDGVCDPDRVVAGQRRRGQDPVPLENRIRLVSCGSSGCQAARAYSLIRPPRTGFRWIGSRSRSVTVLRPPSSSPSGTRWAMPWCGRAVL